MYLVECMKFCDEKSVCAWKGCEVLRQKSSWWKPAQKKLRSASADLSSLNLRPSFNNQGGFLNSIVHHQPEMLCLRCSRGLSAFSKLPTGARITQNVTAKASSKRYTSPHLSLSTNPIYKQQTNSHPLQNIHIPHPPPTNNLPIRSTITRLSDPSNLHHNSERNTTRPHDSTFQDVYASGYGGHAGAVCAQEYV